MRTRIAHTVTRRTNTDAHMVGAHGGSPLEAASADYEVIMMMNDVVLLSVSFASRVRIDWTENNADQSCQKICDYSIKC